MFLCGERLYFRDRVFFLPEAEGRRGLGDGKYAMQSISTNIPGVCPKSLPTVVLTGYGFLNRLA